MKAGKALHPVALLLAMLSLSVLAQGQASFTPENIATERVRINNVRQQANTKFEAEQRECQTTFTVTSCLRDVDTRRIALMSDLKRQEVLLNDAERLEKAISKKKDLEERQAQRLAAEAENTGSQGPSLSQRKQEQQEKLLQHQKKAMPAESNSTAPQSGQVQDPEILKTNRAAHANKLQAAQQRRAERDKRLREAPAKRTALPVPP